MSIKSKFIIFLRKKIKRIINSIYKNSTPFSFLIKLMESQRCSYFPNPTLIPRYVESVFKKIISFRDTVRPCTGEKKTEVLNEFLRILVRLSTRFSAFKRIIMN
jgi:hypothetical protein